MLTLVLALLLCPRASAAHAVVGHALYTDIVAKIDGHALRSYNIKGNIAVVAEELNKHGMYVTWNASSHTLLITREPWSLHPQPAAGQDYRPQPLTHPIGSEAEAIYETDIRTFVDGKRVDSFNIGGKTLVFLKDLSAFGKVTWDASTRTSSLTLYDNSPKQPLHVLMYHDIMDIRPEAAGSWTTTPELFRADLQWLKQNGYVSYLPGELAAGVPIADKAVLITFDDGYASNLTYALPLLREYGMKAVISIIGERITNEVDTFLTWDMCRELAASGIIELGSHTYDLHEGIGRLQWESEESYGRRVFPDIERSKSVMKQEIGKEPLLFAYPHGTVEPWAEDFLRQNFSVTVTSESGTADLANGLYGLPRYNINARQTAIWHLSGGNASGQ